MLLERGLRQLGALQHLSGMKLMVLLLLLRIDGGIRRLISVGRHRVYDEHWQHLLLLLRLLLQSLIVDNARWYMGKGMRERCLTRCRSGGNGIVGFKMRNESRL